MHCLDAHGIVTIEESSAFPGNHSLTMRTVRTLTLGVLGISKKTGFNGLNDEIRC